MPRTARPHRLRAAAAALLLALPTAAAAQAPSPEEVVLDFNNGFQTASWQGLAQRIHPEGLAYLRIALDILVDYDDSGYFLAEMMGETDRDAYGATDDAEIFRRAMVWVQENAAGLLSSLSARRTEILGTVEEGEERHVLYRTIQIAEGARAELRTVSLRRHEGRWRIYDGQDLRSLHTALRGLPRPRDSAATRSMTSSS